MKTFFFLLTAITLSSCASEKNPPLLVKGATVDLKNALAKVEKINRQIEDAIVDADSAKLVRYYHSEARIFPPDQPEGTARNLASAILTIPEAGITRYNLTTTELKEAGELLLEMGDYSYGNETEPFETGNYLVIWKQENNEWKVFRYMWNSDMPILTGSF